MGQTVKQQLGGWLFLRLPITRFLFDILRAENVAQLLGVKLCPA
jgi:hypothetical protein